MSEVGHLASPPETPRAQHRWRGVEDNQPAVLMVLRDFTEDQEP